MKAQAESALEESVRLELELKCDLPRLTIEDFQSAKVLECCKSASLLPRAVAALSTAYNTLWSSVQLDETLTPLFHSEFLSNCVKTAVSLLEAADTITLFLGNKVFNPQVTFPCTLVVASSVFTAVCLCVELMQVVEMASSTSALVKRGQLPKLPTELCSSTLQVIVDVFRKEIVRILKSLLSTRNVEIRRFLAHLEIVDTEGESTDEPVMVISFCSDQFRYTSNVVYGSPYRRFHQTRRQNYSLY